MPPVAKKNKSPTKTAAVKLPEVPEEKLAISGQLEKKIKKSQARVNRQRGVVIIRHLPHGFFEDQLKGYFQQFGQVTRLRLARSTRTGISKGFAFVEFEFPEVAKVAAETMDNYLMFQKVVKAAYIPPESQQYNYFKTSVRKVNHKLGKPIYVSGRSAAVQRKVQEINNWTDEAYQSRIASNLNKVNKLKKQYAHLGIDFDAFTVKPNIQSVTAAAEDDKQKKIEEKSSDEKSAPGSLLLVKKRKQAEGKAEKDLKKSKTEKPVKGKKIELKDLLENTINEEGSSEDEEFIPMAGDDDADTSDEESYGILKGVDSDQDEDSSDDDEEDKPSSPPKRKGKSFEKTKLMKVDRFAELIKRKPHLGGIKKNNKKVQKDKVKNVKPSSEMNTLKLAAVKEIKQQGKMKQIKKADLKKKTNKKQRV